MAAGRKPTADAVEIIHRRYFEGKPDRLAALEEERANVEIACKIAELREDAGLTQRQLARRVGTSGSAICRLESANYEGHSLSMLRRIATALGRKVELRMVPAEKPEEVVRFLEVEFFPTLPIPMPKVMRDALIDEACVNPSAFDELKRQVEERKRAAIPAARRGRSRAIEIE